MTYEFPPTGGGGVQRIAKFARYLPESGWEPVIVAAEVIDGRPLDPTLAEEVAGVRVVRTPARHVGNAISALLAPLKRARSAARTGGSSTGAGSNSSSVQSASLSRRIARWFTIPDDAVFWKGPAVRAAISLGRELGVEAVIATGPPYSVPVAGAKVARALGVPFIADMRDAWDRNPVAIVPTPLHRAYNRRLERRMLAAADAVTCTADAIVAEAEEFRGRRVELLPNGYDPADVPEHRPEPGPLRIAYMGRVYFGHSDPAPVFSAMAQLAKNSGPASDVVFDLVGTYPDSVPPSVEALGIGDRVHFHGYLPHHDALDIVSRADIGLVIVEDRPGSEATAPAKLYEYLAMGMPALLLASPTGFPARVLSETGGGVQLLPGDSDGIRGALERFAAEKAAGTLPAPDQDAVARYDRRRHAARLGELLGELTAHSGGSR